MAKTTAAMTKSAAAVEIPAIIGNESSSGVGDEGGGGGGFIGQTSMMTRSAQRMQEAMQEGDATDAAAICLATCITAIEPIAIDSRR